MQKVTTHHSGRDGKGHHSVDFKPNVKHFTAPEVVDEILMDDGEIHYALANGNTFPKIKYDALWLPPRGVIHPNKFYKGLNPDKTKVA